MTQIEKQQKEEKWIWIALKTSDPHFSVFMKAIKNFGIYPRESVTFINKHDGYTYRMLFDWQDENTHGIELYRKVAP